MTEELALLKIGIAELEIKYRLLENDRRRLLSEIDDRDRVILKLIKDKKRLTRKLEKRGCLAN